jgi:parallel beta-helix repeat protein
MLRGRPRRHTPSCAVLLAILVSVVAVGTGPDGVAQASTSAAMRPGPRRGIHCPAGAVRLRPSRDIQAAVDTKPNGTAFCLRRGTFHITGSITPKTGDSFTGVYGATLDGSGWSTADDTQGAFRCWNQDIDNVTIKNLIIRNMPVRGINGYTNSCDGWKISHNEVFGNAIGIYHGNYFAIRHNYVHDNTQYGILGYKSTGSIIEYNEFARNATAHDAHPGDSSASRWIGASNTTVRGNYFHNNAWSPIWFDGISTGFRVVGNVIMRNGGSGIFIEISGNGVIRNNWLSRGRRHDIYLANSHDVEVVGNTVKTLSIGVQLFQDGLAISQGELNNDFIHDNRISVITADALAGSLYCINLTATECSSYLTSRNNRFQGNAYLVPDLRARYWYWNEGARTWSEWQGIGQDLAGSIRSR